MELVMAVNGIYAGAMTKISHLMIYTFHIEKF